MDDRVTPLVFGTVGYQNGTHEHLFTEDPVILLENSDKNFGILLRTFTILINICKPSLEMLSTGLEWGVVIPEKDKKPVNLLVKFFSA